MPKESEMMSFAVTQEQRMFSLRLDKHQAQPLEIILQFKVLYLHDKNCTFVLPKHLQHNRYNENYAL